MKNFVDAMKSHKSVSMIRDGINLTKEESGYYRKLFVLCQFNTTKLFWLFASVWFLFQLLMVVTEIAFWGETFPNVIDPLMTGAIFAGYLKALSKMSDFLISHALDSDKPILRVITK